MAGTITPYDTAQGTRYRVRYRKPDGAQTDKRGFKTKRDANLYLSSVTVTKARGEYISPADAKRTIADLAEHWKRARLPQLKPSSQAVMETSWRTHVEPAWASRQVGSIRKLELQTWVGELGKAKSAQTVRRAAFVLGGILDIAVDDRAIITSPMKGVVLPAKNVKENVYLSHAQVDLLVRSCVHPELVQFLAYSGLRWGEAAGLRIRRVEGRKVNVVENAVIVGGSYKLGTPKTGASRTVIVPKFVAESLQKMAGERPGEDFVFGGIDPIMYPHATSGWFVKAVRSAQWEDTTFPTITLHGLRHTAASLAVSSGANVKAVQRMLGHASAAMTLDVYADLFDEDLGAVADALDKARSAALK